MATLYYYTTVSNSYLHESRTLKAQTKWELELKANDQIAKWVEKEKKQREAERKYNTKAREQANVEKLKSQSEDKDAQARQEQEEYAGILAATLAINDALDWNQMRQTTDYKAFVYKREQPKQRDYYLKNGVPEERFIEHIFSSVKKKRLLLEKAAMDEYTKALDEYQAHKQAVTDAYEKDKAEYLQAQKAYNDDIDRWKEHFEQGDADAVEKYMRVVLANSHYPQGIDPESEISYEVISKTAIVNLGLPTPEDISGIIGYKFIQSRKEIEPIEMKQKDKNQLYESVIQQMALRTIHELFEGVYVKELLGSIVFNGWVNAVDQSTGKDFSACILSVQASREEFESLNLARVEPKECLRKMKALSAGPLASLAPVKPIMELNHEDRRFISSVDVMDSMDENTNLAVMPWENFEHLVRQLFSQIFSKEGAEVRVTQASRDGGVDAIAFDPDPIRGGKFVIQAKRYNNVVPVSACRDLYGTMINEGAVKGILVTTSYYGNDSREFAKDKPITLIDGSNLVYMLNEYGHSFHINLKEQS